ncbi:TRAP transporter substrate-binding protein [Aestuariispira insulae]|uniref:TRAP-type C4-dicarboxylate transport system substrate-binding protein n=1 Tax=Aestuariispira insulae TaxID=1461337 RepID=A0A3D9HJU3_9PROT|nr:TRAP transporter substrate-binding protein [Aestuariispira insulae]RED49779.1 TRAP-type C4-dicarboxylate transport system substrate-binding protein [Aestuariispira insulae]
MKLGNRIRLWTVTLAVTLSASAGAILTQKAQAEEYPETKLQVVGTWSHLSQFKNFEQPFWAEEIPAQSGGAITANVKGFNDMGLKGAEVVRLINSGALHFGSTVLGYLAADDPINEAIDLAGLSPTIETARSVTDAFRPVLAKRYEERYGIKLLGIWPYSAQVLFCNSPVNSLADLKGKKVRTANRTLAEFVEALGGTGVTMAFSEVVIGLQNNLLDCAITGTLSGYSAKWHEVSTHLYELPVGWSQVIHAVNIDVWNSLDAKVQSFLQTRIEDLENRIWTSAAEETIQGINCNTGAGECQYGDAAGMTFVPISDADRKLLSTILKETVLPVWAERCGADCTGQWNNTVGKVLDINAG